MGHRVLPSDGELERMISDGWTHQQIADEAYRRHGRRVTRNAVTVAIHRAGLGGRNPRHAEQIPWTVKLADQKEYDLWMLRVGARLAKGEEVSEDQRVRFARWEEKLRGSGRVVWYDSENGFQWVRRHPADGDGLVRTPSVERKLRSDYDKLQAAAKRLASETMHVKARAAKKTTVKKPAGKDPDPVPARARTRAR